MNHQKNEFLHYEDKGLTGLANVGNSCYLNSCMQIISHTYESNDLLDITNENGETVYQTKLNRKPDSVLLLEWDKLRKLMWSENCTIAPHAFVLGVQKIARLKDKDIFTGYAQNDLPEFLLFIIDCFHNAIQREVEMNIKGTIKNKTDKMAKVCYKMMENMYKREYSELLDVFYGIHISQIKSLDNKKVLSLTPEPFSVINLPIPDKDNVHLFDCMDLYCKNEIMEGENAWYNEKTDQKEDVQKGIIFWSLPNVMIIDLKRFTNMNRKIHKEISIPINNADFSKYVKGYKKSSYVYDLYGICNHEGSVLGGHYTAYVKNANNKWYLFNDTSVKQVDEDSIIGAQSYCLFYRKKKN
jgi:ubiquitin C-terminal hydrolase